MTKRMVRMLARATMLPVIPMIALEGSLYEGGGAGDGEEEDEGGEVEGEGEDEAFGMGSGAARMEIRASAVGVEREKASTAISEVAVGTGSVTRVAGTCRSSGFVWCSSEVAITQSVAVEGISDGSAMMRATSVSEREFDSRGTSMTYIFDTAVTVALACEFRDWQVLVSCAPGARVSVGFAGQLKSDIEFLFQNCDGGVEPARGRKEVWKLNGRSGCIRDVVKGWGVKDKGGFVGEVRRVGAQCLRLFEGHWILLLQSVR